MNCNFNLIILPHIDSMMSPEPNLFEWDEMKIHVTVYYIILKFINAKLSGADNRYTFSTIK